MASHKHLKVSSPLVKYTDDHVTSEYLYQTSTCEVKDGEVTVTPREAKITFRTELKPKKLGVMIVGLAGNNGSTIVAGVIANREGICWRTRTGVQTPNYYGSVTQASTTRLGYDASGDDLYIPLSKLLPMVDPNSLVIGGWDINNADLATAMERAQVLDYDLQRQLVPFMTDIVPLPSIYIADFIAANQAERANNVLTGSKLECMERVRKDIRDFKKKHDLEKVIVLWSANTERFSDILTGVNDTMENLFKSIEKDEPEVSPSTLFAVASILEGCPYINGSPQNTFVPGLLELATKMNVSIGGDDFKTGQTKMKSVLVDWLISAGIKPTAIASYNHLGNNDGKNLSAPRQFRSKEISKSNVVDDMVASNDILYKPGEHPDHIVVIKYLPYVGDSKRALDEYTSEIFMGGRNTIVMHNTCEDSLLAAPVMLDLIILSELVDRISYKTETMESFEHFHPVMSVLSYLLKAPLVPQGAPVVNALFKQRSCIENLFKACVGLPPDNHMGLEHKTKAVLF